ncbi:MAG: DUF1801 domain-containing protein [Candidatus Hermodarchaeia archaeon]|jgi:uncharacterized protein YdhG (YjbR/CyaY superfamily)
MRRDASSPSAYRADVSGELSEILESNRSLIFEVTSQVKEGIKYGMLHYSLNEVDLALLAAQKHYVSLYLDPQVVDQYRPALKKLDIGKSCLRYRRMSQLDSSLEGYSGFNTSENTVPFPRERREVLVSN